MRNIAHPRRLPRADGGRNRGQSRQVVVGAIIVLVLAGCTVLNGNVTATPAPSVAESPVPLPSRSPVPLDATGAGLTITGTAKDVSLSARVIFLGQPAEGISTIALAEGCRVTTESGRDIDLREIRPGFTLRASGHADGSGAMLATSITVIGRSSTRYCKAPTRRRVSTDVYRLLEKTGGLT